MTKERKVFLMFAIMTSGVMSLIISGVSTLRATGGADGFFGIWMGAWAFSWAVAFPCLFVFVPPIRRLAAKIVG